LAGNGLPRWQIRVHIGAGLRAVSVQIGIEIAVEIETGAFVTAGGLRFLTRYRVASIPIPISIPIAISISIPISMDPDVAELTRDGVGRR